MSHQVQKKSSTAFRLTTVRHLVSIPPAPTLLADMIASSPILFDPEMGGGGGGSGGDEGAGGDGGAIDPNMDPELAMVRLTASSRSYIELT